MSEQKNKMTVDQLIAAMGAELGQEPETMKILAGLDERVVFEHAANKNFAFSGEHIPAKYKLLMSLAISAALGVEKCIETYTTVALRKGFSKEEILEAMLVARFVKATTVISTTTSSMRMVLEQEQNVPISEEELNKALSDKN
jgi:alkylhydroperoxidase/carboxymuconolactone decarboxylase family protein YurZ